MKTIKKVILHNFKRFKHLEIIINPELNIFVGDNESGKSSILQAIELVARGSRHRVEEIGLERLMNIEVVNSFMSGSKSLDLIPEMYVELYFMDTGCMELEGANNSLHNPVAHGIKMVCKFNGEYGVHVRSLLENSAAVFPYEFYSIDFTTFSGSSYNGYTKYLNTIYIDNSQIGNPRAMNEYVRKIYLGQVSFLDRMTNRHSYHTKKLEFSNEVLTKYNQHIAPYRFSIKESSVDNIETDINLLEYDVPIENKGTGVQCFIKTELALKNAVEHTNSENSIDAVLIEEPENHLSYTRMVQLIDMIKTAEQRQLFITTHSDLISTRLNLKQCILLNSSSSNSTSLAQLSESTARFFMKAPDNNMLQFVLSKKVILVEGDAEFILMDYFYKTITGRDASPKQVAVIAVDGKCFKRYLEIARLLGMKVAVITDNDKNYEENIVHGYRDFTNDDNIKIFADRNDELRTFEICLYNQNKALIDRAFTGLRKNGSLEFMLSNKAEAAFRLLENHSDALQAPGYIKDAIQWIDALS